MYFVYILSFVLVILMARRARRKFRRYLKGRIDFELALSTLGPNAVLSGNESNVLTESAYLSSVKCTFALADFTQTADDGPIWFGVAHRDYTDGEIETFIEEGASWNVGDIVATREVNRRLIRQIGVFGGVASDVGIDVYNLGKPITVKCGWMLNTGQTVKFWVYNSGSGTLTTGAKLHVNGHANLWPK